jgi:glycosyltransferase involved in cell wall biosynthesis
MNIDFCLLLGSYNCEKTIYEQLDSIHKSFAGRNYQCVYFDDFSSDSSLKIIKSFFRDKNITSYKVPVNKKIRVSEKFYKLFKVALLNTNSKTFFLVDGDDIWLKNKVSSTVSAMKESPAGLVLSKTIQFGKVSSVILPKVERLFLLDFFFNISPGMSFAISRANLRNFIYYGGCNYIWHDHGLFLFSKYVGNNIVVVNKILQKYRRHDLQYTSIHKFSLFNRGIYASMNLLTTLRIYTLSKKNFILKNII